MDSLVVKINLKIQDINVINVNNLYYHFIYKLIQMIKVLKLKIKLYNVIFNKVLRVIKNIFILKIKRIKVKYQRKKIHRDK